MIAELHALFDAYERDVKRRILAIEVGTNIMAAIVAECGPLGQAFGTTDEGGKFITYRGVKIVEVRPLFASDIRVIGES